MFTIKADAYPICDSPLSRQGQHNFAPLQKSRRNHPSYVWTGMVFVLGKNLASIVWTKPQFPHRQTPPREKWLKSGPDWLPLLNYTLLAIKEKKLFPTVHLLNETQRVNVSVSEAIKWEFAFGRIFGIFFFLHEGQLRLKTCLMPRLHVSVFAWKGRFF